MTAQDWDALVKRAEDEGEVAVYAKDSIGNAQTIWSAFQRRYPKIKLVGTSVGRGSDLFPKPFSDRRAGKFLADVFLAGPTAIQINRAFRDRGIDPARDQRGCSPPLETPFDGARGKPRGILD